MRTDPRRSLPRLLGLAALAAAACLAAGCVSTPTSGPSAEAAALERRARAAEDRGDARAAMQLYRQLADAATGNARAGYLIEAARLAVDAGDTALASEWLAEADPLADAAQRQSVVVLLAELDVRASRPQAALARLEGMAEPGSIRVMTDAESVRGRALFALGRTAEAVRALVERETWLESSEAILENQRMIWNGLASPATADAEPTGDELIDGWLALAPIAAAGFTGAELRGALVDWRREHASHPAITGLLADLLAADRSDGAYPDQIALLLPISSPQPVRDLAIAIRDGFMAAHLGSEGNDQVSIFVYDTARLGAEEAYRRAQLEGAAFIVGPLLGPEVNSIVPRAGFVPTLALNFSDADASLVADFWQFALAPEDETRAIARRAYADGARTAVALVPFDPSGWGLRLLNSFREEFEALGGRLLEYETYDRAAADFSAPIEALLNLDLSQQRRTRLQANLGMNLSFEARRREDADMLFLATPDRGVARLLAPALRLYLAGGEPLPVYANSEVHEPGSAAREGDLNDIFFPDAPWLLAPNPRAAELLGTLQRYWPQRASSGNLRLYGMGVDAYRLVGALYAGAYRWPVEGLSGQLELDADGRVHRSLPFAQFRNGRPVALEPLPLEQAPPAEDVPEPAAFREFVGSR